MTVPQLRLISRAGTLVVAGLILLVSLTPAIADEGSCALGACGVVHALAFAILGVCLAGTYASSAMARRSPRRMLAMVLLGLWLFAASTELLQPAVGRDPSLGDWLADMLGGVGGFLLGGTALRVVLPRVLRAEEPLDRREPRGRRRRGRRAR